MKQIPKLCEGKYMDLPCKTCIVLPRCKQLICPNPPRFVSSSKIVRYLLLNKFQYSRKCDRLLEYCIAGGKDENGALVNIYKVTDFFSKPYGEYYNETDTV